MQAGRLTALILCAGLLAASAPAMAQAYPAKPIRIVVTISGIGEALIRMTSQKMAANLGSPVIVEGQAAAGGAIGAESVMRAAPDGYTVLATTPGTHVFRQFLTKNTTFDPIKDFTPITLAFEAIAAVSVHPSLPVNSFRELLDYARRNPGKLSYGTSGIGTTHHMASEMIALSTGISMVHVPYKQGTQATQDALAGRVQVLFGVFAALQPYSGKLKILAITNDRRFPPAGDIPTVREIVPSYTSPPFWTSYYGPALLADPLVRRLQAEIVKALTAPEVRGKFTEAGFLVIGSTPEELAATNKADIEQAARVVKAAGIQPE